MHTQAAIPTGSNAVKDRICEKVAAVDGLGATLAVPMANKPVIDTAGLTGYTCDFGNASKLESRSLLQ